MSNRLRLSTVAALVLLSAAHVEAAPAPLEIFGASDAVRVFEDGYGRPDRLAEVRVFGLRNEIVSGQCVVEAHEDLKGLKVSVSALRHSNGRATIPAENAASK
ncbi:hypothetical protein FJY63_03460, partial [Candidatus Sumerlaeota bacterium]|nr:hypothetical protein [Candidatus Sumerlaeota bacterium]